MPTMRIGVVQLQSTTDVERNLDAIERLAVGAVAAGAQLVALPENAPWIRVGAAAPPVEPRSGGRIQQRLSALARRLGCPLAVGSLLLYDPGEEHPTNTSLLIDASGAVVASYDKIHLFRVDLGPAVRFDERAHVRPGRDLVVADLGNGLRLGLSVCYDLRFPELYQRLVDAGANVLLVPAAFTVPTGEAHWHVLLRARAIETQCFVVAAAQSGAHGEGRASYGHALVVDPWGKIVCDLEDGERFAVVELDLDRVAEVRRSLPCREHRVALQPADPTSGPPPSVRTKEPATVQ